MRRNSYQHFVFFNNYTSFFFYCSQKKLLICGIKKFIYLSRLISTNMNREKRIQKVTLIGTFINLALLILKFFAGFAGKSGAMVADAIHSLSDFITDIIVFVFVKISGKPKDKDHDYGHAKYETLATVIIGIMLFAIGVLLAVNGIKSIWGSFHGETLRSPGLIALIAAAVSIVVKEGLYRYTHIEATKVSSPAMEANAWHHRSDAFSSIGTLIGIGGAYFGGDKWLILDPIAAIVVSILIMKVSIELVLPGLNDLLEKSLPDNKENEILEIVNNINGVSNSHNLRTRRLGAFFAIEIDIRVNPKMTVDEAHLITKEIEHKIREHFGEGQHIIVHVEPE